ncbi:hypothetical protein PENTCL1PPCAC_16822, partial [Pristionchus entomophagus]
VLGIILCSFLLFCLLFRTRHDLGTYRYLQRIVTAEGVFGMVPASPLVTDKAVLCAYVSFYTITFVMIDYSFLYRMWAVKSFISVYYLYLPTEWGRRRLRESTFIDFGIDTQSAVMVMGDYFLTIIPLIFLYSPCGVMIVLPLFRVNSQWMARATPFLITFFLPLDALAVILSMTEYRRVLLKII